MTGAVYAVMALVIVGLYYSGGERFLPRDAFEGAHQATSLPALYMLFLLWACTIGPVGEELFMRGLVYNALKGRLPLSLALVIQALLFAIFHPQPPTNMVVLFFDGLFLGAIYEWRKTLLTPILIHAAINAISVIVLLISVALNAGAPVLGVYGEDRVAEFGCVVTAIVPGSAADEAGLKIGDIIVGIDGEGVADFRHLTWMIRSRTIGQTITMQFYREGVLLETRAVLKERNKIPP